MKTFIVFALFMAVACAYQYDNDYSNSVNCFADRCLACQNFFGSQLATFDCEGQCGLCVLCNAATDAIVPGCARCKDGVDACVATCKKGQKICSACSSHCGLGYSQ